MTAWEYTSISLADLPLKTRPLDLLNDARLNGRELVGLTANGVAYLQAPGRDAEAAARTRVRVRVETKG